MHRLPLLSALALALTACNGGDGSLFGTGGAQTDPPTSGSDTGDTGGGGDPDAPTITRLTAEFYTPPQLSTVIELYAWYSDPQNDVDGGRVDLTVVASDGSKLSDTVDIDGKYARLDTDLDGDPVWLWVSGTDGGAVDTSLSYELTVILEDAAGHRSAPASTSL
ncbi:MAG: hypothetical protein D6798_12720 [Deltaproteobacteria bacterium]|nr:MAG: hypothetical protein D6798_12720 [Deltaproteobacteria bacterium]